MSSAASTESRLAAAAQAGDGAAFGELYRRYVRRVYRYLRLQVGDDALAEDLTQDVFLGLYRGLADFRPAQPVAPWVMQSARNRLVNHWRHRGRRLAEFEWPDEELEVAVERDAAGLLAVAGPGPGPESGAEDLPVPPEQLLAAIGALTPLQQEVIALRFGSGLTLAEAGEVLGRSVNAVKNAQFKALAALRRQLAAEEAQV